jgi:hypothetical protein
MIMAERHQGSSECSNSDDKTMGSDLGFLFSTFQRYRGSLRLGVRDLGIYLETADNDGRVVP